MTKKEIAQRVRIEANELEAIVKKLQFRLEHLQWLAESLESEGKPPSEQNKGLFSEEGKFRKMLNKVYGE